MTKVSIIATEPLIKSLLSALDNAGEHQWSAGDLVLTLKSKMQKVGNNPEKGMDLKDIYLAINRRYSISYLSILSSVAKMYPVAMRKEIADLGATFHDCRQCYRLQQNKDYPVFFDMDSMALLKEYLAAKEACFTSKETDITGDAAPSCIDPYELVLKNRGAKIPPKGKTAKTPEKLPKGSKPLDDPFKVKYADPRTKPKAQKVFDKAWMGMSKALVSTFNRLRKNSILVAIEIDPAGVPRFSGYENCKDEAKRQMLYSAIAYLALKEVPLADGAKLVAQMKMTAGIINDEETDPIFGLSKVGELAKA